jgi:RHS repeat-associated protein
MIKRVLILIICVLFHRVGCAQNVQSSSAVVLPASGQTSYTITSASGLVNISSPISVTLNPGVTIASGSTVVISIANPIVYPTPPSNPSNDNNLNWVLTRDYDENGNEVGTSKSFYDNNGKEIQTQVKNESTGYVLATATLYDLQQRAAVKTLAAPLNNSAFAYSSSFVTNNSLPYNYLNFDGNPSTNTYGKLNSPDAIDNSTIGTLGWYYSNNNEFDNMVPATSYPYSRVDYFSDGTGAVKYGSGIGEQLNMGSGHEIKNVQFPVMNELNNYLTIRNQYFPQTVVGASPTTLAGSALQSVSTDQNGLQLLSVTDLGGKQLMTARADPNGYLSVSNTFTISNQLPLYTFTATNQGGFPIQTLTINSPYVVTVASLNDNNSPSCGCVSPEYTGIGNSYVYSGSDENSYSVISSSPFTVTEVVTEIPLINPNVTIYDQAEGQLSNPSVPSIQYFQLTNASAVTITGSNFSLTDMKTEADITSTFTSGNILAVGYYKVTANPTTATGVNPAGTNSITVTYSNKYTDISYNYYNQLGQLIGSIAPNGVYLLNTNGLSAYGSVNAVPFLTHDAYDLQGRLISTTTPDAGTTNFIYRQDGKIRFSQNAAQVNPANAGTGNVEKFSYTNYDQIGRPIESGEYAVTSATFANLATNTTVLEATDPTGGLSGGIKTMQINTVYDLPAISLALAGYLQDPGFLKGAVSYTYSTTNGTVNSTTWYNYDDHGRVTWVVKNLAGLGYKTIDYVYNAQGNVTSVDYQRNTAAERFVHTYTYDADGRLITVQTSRDNINQTQQANYYYYLHGPLKRIELGNQIQGIDYVYTPQGWLKSVNSATGVTGNDPNKDGLANSFAPDAFGMQLEYFSGDYNRSNSNINSIATGQNYYNGNVTGMSWQSQKPLSVAATGPAMYTYNYDSKYQLTGATWATPNFSTNNFTQAASPPYSETVVAGNYNGVMINYDFNGNLMGLRRTAANGAVMDNDMYSSFSYNTNTTAGTPTNQLNSVGNTANPTAYASYTYNQLGQLQSEVGPSNAPYYVAYDVTGKITGIYSNPAMTTPLVTYTYDEGGNRISRTDQNGTTYFVYDEGGNIMAIYTGTTMAEVPVYGSSRLGTYYLSANNYVYELRDNVGSVRVLLNNDKINNKADVMNYADYYPFGSIARNGGTGYRYDYQGAYAEKDAVTDWNNFEARMYDGRIGRWLTIDPNQQFASPYEAMGNSPGITVDKDGKFALVDTFIAAGAGFVIGAGINIGAQLLTGTSFSNLNWKSAGISGLQGAATGALASFGVPPVLNITLNAALGAGANYADQKFAQNNGKISVGQVVGAGVTNGIAAGIAGSLFTNVRNNALWQNVNKNFIERAAVYSKSATAAAFDGVANLVNSVLWDETNKFLFQNNSIPPSFNDNPGDFGFISINDGPSVPIPFTDSK